jgi:hypothetical protein
MTAMKASMTSPTLGCTSVITSTQEVVDLHWYNSNQTTPAKPDSATIKKAHVETISSSLDLRENLAIIFRNAGW